MSSNPAAPGRHFVQTLQQLVDLTGVKAEFASCSAANFARIDAVARLIPAAAARYFGFEWVLGTGACALDFSVNLMPDECDSVVPSNVWALGEFDRENVWLEWDTSQSGDRGASLYFTLDTFKELSPAAVRALAADRRGAQETLRRCISCAPESATRLHVGHMSTRGRAGFRIGMQMMSAAEACAFLTGVGCISNAQGFAALLARFSDVCDGFSVQLDCTPDTIHPVGAELIYRGSPLERQPACEPRWHVLLERLVQQGLATANESSALAAWPSSRPLRAPLVERLMALAPELRHERVLHGTLARGLQHIKLATRDGRNVTAKAYFGAAFFDA